MPPGADGGWLTRRLGIRYPIVAAPMFLASSVTLLRAVADAGGVGVIPALNFRSTAELVQGLAALRGQPFGVNLILLGNPRLADDLEACAEARVPLIVTSLGDPTVVAARAGSWDACVLCDVTNERHAIKARNAGAEGLVAVTAGAGGHGGVVSPFVLGPVIAEATGLPVLLAGGVVDGRSLAAALALGYCGVYVGTRFLATRESAASEGHKKAVLEARLNDVEYTAEVTGHPANFLSASLAAFRQAGTSGLSSRAWRDVYSGGQSAALTEGLPGAGEVVRNFMLSYEEALRSAAAFSPLR